MTVEPVVGARVDQPEGSEGLPNPAVSVVIPAHNVWPWITECLRSILLERRVPLEVILVDDGSTDSTLERASDIAREDRRLRVMRSDGVGGGQARNIGAALARGDYLMFCDADDIVAPDGILRMYQAAVLSRADMVVGNFLKFSASRTWSPTERWKLFNERQEAVTLHDLPELIRNRACWNRLFARSFWEREAIRFPTVPRSNDIVPMTIVLTQAKRITVIPEIVYLYRQRPGNGSMTARAASTVGTVSYLIQEEICRALVSSLNDEPLNAVYWGMLLDSDAWVQCSRYLQHLSMGGAVSTEVERHIGRIVTERRGRSWARVRAERQGIYSLIGAGHSHRAAALWQDFESRDGSVTAEFLERQLEMLSLLAKLGEVTADALSELYTQLILMPFLRAGSDIDVERFVSLASSQIADLGVSLRVRNPSAEIESAHRALASGDETSAKHVTLERAIQAPTVGTISVGRRTVLVEFGARGKGTIVGAELRQQDLTVPLFLAPFAGPAGGPRVRTIVSTAAVRQPGPWQLWAGIAYGGVEVWRQVFLEGPDLVPGPKMFAGFSVRRPSTRQPLTIVRRRSLRERVARRTFSSLKDWSPKVRVREDGSRADSGSGGDSRRR